MTKGVLQGYNRKKRGRRPSLYYKSTLAANDIPIGTDARNEFFMRECLVLAEEGRGEVGNGAMVGAILVSQNNIIAQGIHRGFGKAHAERDLLEHFGGNVSADATLYVNLEPCCHVGKTPPCTEIIRERGVKRVCIGMQDPDTRVSGRGAALLRENGVEVIGQVASASCEYLNRGFVSMRTKGRPWVILKSARIRDGRTAGEHGSPLKITSAEQDRWAHAALRSRVDAILTGVQTVISDDPRLDTRL
ncbi:MAG: bifunctional diaminohydroxyphosphoribosylaminopyrimidine deaminase/5-amino-6-(5-phosphoribosylamino)uracil reductase RibD, partial [Patescibacteria group bacterium]